MSAAVNREPGWSVRLKLTLSYAGFVMLAGAVLLTAGYFSLSRGVHPGVLFLVTSHVDLLRYFAPIAAAVMVFLLLFGLLGGWFLAGRMLSPLTRITDAARLAERGSLSHRIRLPGRSNEFGELADAFDAMLARLETHVEEQKRFAANASHELRTPLAITQALLDVARHDPDHEGSELLDRLHAVNTRAIDLTEALLLLSRADAGRPEHEQVDLSLIAEDATEILVPFAERRRVTIETSADVCFTTGSRALLLQVITNLVHNAIVHNLPDQGGVWVSTSLRSGAAVLTVENTGDTLDPDVLPTLVEPFARGSARVRAGHAGVGLGLAIVRKIIEAHDGTLTLAPRPRGGLHVTVLLPAAQLPAASRTTPPAAAAGHR